MKDLRGEKITRREQNDKLKNKETATLDSETTSNSESTGVDNGQKLSVKLVEFRQQLVQSRE